MIHAKRRARQCTTNLKVLDLVLIVIIMQWIKKQPPGMHDPLFTAHRYGRPLSNRSVPARSGGL